MSTSPLRLWDKLPFVGRLLLINGLALLIAGGLMLYSVEQNEASEAQADLDLQLNEELASLLPALSDALVIGDYSSIQQTLDRRVRRPHVIAVRFVDVSGATLESTDHAEPAKAPPWFAPLAKLHDVTGKTEASIGGRDYGKLEVTFTAQIAVNRLWKHLTEHLFVLLLAITLDFLGIWLVLRGGLKPLWTLRKAAGLVEGGDLAIRVEPSGSPELRHSILAFNNMARAIEVAHHNQVLEKERLQVTLSSIGDAVMTTDREGRVEFMNAIAETLTGWSRSEARGRLIGEVFNIVSEETRGRVDNPVDRVFREGRIVQLANHTLLIGRDGVERPIADSAAPIRVSEKGEILGAVLVFRDQTEERERYNELRLSGSVFEHAQEGITITDADAHILRVNPAFTALTGYSEADVVGHNPSMLSSGLQEPGFYASLWKTLLETGQWRGEIWNRKKNGDLIAELLSITAVSPVVGGKGYYVGIFTDITELKSHQQHLEHLAHYDALTQLPNRVLLADRLQIALAQVQRVNGVLAICYLDLDGFKPVNDEYGHEAGDRLLVEVASRLTMALRAGDTVARLGGDEFVLLMSGLRGADECRTALDRLLKVVSKPYEVADQAVVISASIGATLFPHDASDPDALLRHADQAMYTAKEGGRNRYHLFDPEHDRLARAQREALSRIEAGLPAGEYVLYYQPKVDMRLGKVIGVEALIRWNHPERGLLSPAEFLPYIENTEFSIELGEWVIEQALSQMEEWQRMGVELPVSVNISARHLQQTDLAADLAATLARYASVPPHNLELEILETSALDDILHATRLITECQRLGVSFALDDFGTGYSSLSYFKRLPAQTLKIDQSFIRDMLRNPEDLTIVEGVIGLARAFRRNVVAEGVETVAHGMVLLHLGCDLAQGYGIARPMPAAAIPGWIADWRPDPRWEETIQQEWPRQDLHLQVAEFDHRDWVERVTDWIRSDSMQGADGLNSGEHNNLFELWRAGAEQEQPDDRESYETAWAAHHRIVDLIKELIDQKRMGEVDQARRRLNELETLNQVLLDQLRRFHSPSGGLAGRPG